MVMLLSTVLLSFQASGGGPVGKASYEYYIKGDPGNVETSTEPGLLLAGGSTDVAEAMLWMIDRSGGGDFVVIRCSGTDAYNPWIFKQLGGVDSCETILFVTDSACYDGFVLERINNAEALFIAGGDQSDYVKMWKDTPVEDAIHAVAKRAPVGGTSAGLAILGEFSFSAMNDTVYSDDALSDPYNRRVTIERDFLHMPDMEGKVTDSHFVARDRMGRLVTFLARIIQDGWATQAMGIGIDEKTALAVDESGDVTLFGACQSESGTAYFLRTNGPPAVCEPKTPLTFEGISVFWMTDTSEFNLATWEGTGGTEYTLSAVDGVLVSDLPGGSVY